jgi:hypothetical protein
MIHAQARTDQRQWERATMVMLGLALLVVGFFTAV